MKNISIELLNFLIISIIFTSVCQAQIQFNNRLINDNKTGINAAYAGEFDKVRISVLSGSTAARLDNAQNFMWQQAIVDLPLINNASSATIFTNVKQGNFTQFEIAQSFSYKVSLSSNQSLSAGLGVSYTQRSINNGNSFTPNDYVDLQDPYLLENSDATNAVDLKVGLVYKYKELQVAVALPSIELDNQKNIGFTAYSEYAFKINEKFDLTPSILMIEAQIKRIETTTSLNLSYNKRASIQIGYSNFEQIVTSFGANYRKVTFGYSYAFSSNSNFKSLVGNTNQFGLFFNL